MQPLRGLGRDHHAAGQRELLQPGSKVRRGAERLARLAGDRRRLACRQRAHDHAPGGDPDAQRERQPVRRRQVPYRGNRRERRAHRAFGIVLVRDRVAEVCPYRIAEEPRHLTTIALDRLDARLVVAPVGVKDVLGLQALREAGRIDKVEEGDRQRPVLGALFRAREGELIPLDGAAESQPIPERQAQLAELAIRQLRELIDRDPLGNEARDMITQLSCEKPAFNIHPDNSFGDSPKPMHLNRCGGLPRHQHRTFIRPNPRRGKSLVTSAAPGQVCRSRPYDGQVRRRRPIQLPQQIRATSSSP